MHIRRHAKKGLQGYETVSDAPDGRWLPTMNNAVDAVLRAAELPLGEERAGNLKTYLLGRGEFLSTWITTGGLAQSNLAEQGDRFHQAGKRKVSGGSRSAEGARRTAVSSSVHATAQMRLTNIREVGERILRGNPAPFPEGAGPKDPRVW